MCFDADKSDAGRIITGSRRRSKIFTEAIRQSAYRLNDEIL